MQNDTAPSDKSSGEDELRSLLASASRKRPRWPLRIISVVIVFTIGYFAYAYLSKDPSYSYTTTTVGRGDVIVIVTATGSVEPTVQVDISSEQSGTIREVFVDHNSQVKKGDVLARLDTDKLTAEFKAQQAALAAARASLAKAKADEMSAKASLDRLKALVNSRVSSQQDLDSADFAHQAAEAVRQSAEANVIAAEAALEQAELSLSKANIVSPIDGIVLARDVDNGATVAASLEAPVLFTIAGDLRQMELQVSVDEADVGQVAVGQKATFTVDAFPDKRFPAEITSVRYAAETVNDVVTYKGILTVRNDDLLLRQGMTATADIIVNSATNALIIPNAALRYSPPQQTGSTDGAPSGGSIFSIFRPPQRSRPNGPEPTGTERTVWLLRNGEPVSVNIEIDATDGQNTVVVKGDIQEGDAVITDSALSKN